MTEKELLYMEDAISHEANLVKICELTIDNLEDKDLQTFMKNHLKRHDTLKQKLMTVMEDLANE